MVPAGAPASVNPYVSDQVHQEDAARFFWDNFLDIEVPCQSLLNSPTSLAAADVARRDAVRTRNLAFNAVLREECGSVLRCRYDDDLFFNFSSNRVNPPHGPLLPRNQWGFEDRDISNNHKTGSIDFSFLCPVNFTYDGCGDHFHPSLIGQQKLANAGMLASYRWATDATAPTVSLAPSRPPDGAGRYAAAVNVAVSGSDAAGVRGYEVRVHQPDGSVGPWVEHVGTAPTVAVSATGLTYVEARALDVNGNLSASTSLGVEIDPVAFGTLAGTVVDGDGAPIAGATVARHAAATEGALESATTGADGRYDFGAVLTGSYALRVTDPSGTHVAQWFDGAASHATATPVVVGSQAAAIADVVLAEVGLAGQVTEDGTGTGVAGAWVLALHRDDHTFAAAAVADGDGRYELGLAPGDHEVFVVDRAGAHAAEWSDDSPTQAGADTVTVAPGAVETLDVALAPAGRTASISGTVTDDVTGDPVPGALAFAVSTGGVPTRGAVADAAGNYVIEALPAGSYHVIVFDGAGAHRPEFFDDATGFNDGDPVTLAAGASVVADAALAPTAPPAGGAALTGHLTDSASGAPLEGAVAIALRSADYSFVAAGLTDAAGAYALDVGPGQYRVELIDPTFLHAMEWYDDLPYHQIADAVGVDVAVGAPAVVDAALDPAGPSAAIAGTVTGTGGAPFEGALVLAIGADGNPAGGAVTGADGTYFIPGLTTGNHLVVFVDPSGAGAPEFHVDAASPAAATLVTTAAGQITPVDAALTPPP